MQLTMLSSGLRDVLKAMAFAQRRVMEERILSRRKEADDKNAVPPPAGMVGGRARQMDALKSLGTASQGGLPMLVCL